MILKDSELQLRQGDVVKTSGAGNLVVERIITLTLCRCRQCEDRCLSLSDRVLCVHCNNHHTQMVGKDYKGPYTGPRRVLEHLAKIDRLPPKMDAR